LNSSSRPAQDMLIEEEEEEEEEESTYNNKIRAGLIAH
jgi:hypothetical protein